METKNCEMVHGNYSNPMFAFGKIRILKQNDDESVSVLRILLLEKLSLG